MLSDKVRLDGSDFRLMFLYRGQVSKDDEESFTDGYRREDKLGNYLSNR